MVNDARWLLPEGIEEILPSEAMQLEKLRRDVIDSLLSKNFQLVMPPLMEFVDSLLTGTGEELDTQTYKFMDQHTHRMLGIRADMTPQVARIDAHFLAENAVNRLCYAGTVLRAQAEYVGGQRELLQTGAEIFGVSDESADIDIIDAMLGVLYLSSSERFTLSLGHVGLYRALLNLSDIPVHLEAVLFDTLLRKSLPDLMELGEQANVEHFISLLKCQGSIEQIGSAHQSLPENAAITAALEQLQRVVAHMQANHPDVQLHIDLADVFGYRYHTGLKFSAFLEGRGRPVAKGGRYDRIGEQFGHARPATGFSADLKSLVKLT